eukprot:6177244-Pleurochrysis_carterae.AAC.1
MYHDEGLWSVNRENNGCGKGGKTVEAAAPFLCARQRGKGQGCTSKCEREREYQAKRLRCADQKRPYAE